MEKVIDLRTCNEGMSCEQYTLLAIAGPHNMPLEVKKRMEQHRIACGYHNSEGFRQSVLDTPVTETLEAEALKLVEELVTENQ